MCRYPGADICCTWQCRDHGQWYKQYYPYRWTDLHVSISGFGACMLWTTLGQMSPCLPCTNYPPAVSGSYWWATTSHITTRGHVTIVVQAVTRLQMLTVTHIANAATRKCSNLPIFYIMKWKDLFQVLFLHKWSLAKMGQAVGNAQGEWWMIKITQDWILTCDHHAVNQKLKPYSLANAPS